MIGNSLICSEPSASAKGTAHGAYSAVKTSEKSSYTVILPISRALFSRRRGLMSRRFAAVGLLICSVGLGSLRTQGPTPSGITREEFAKLGYQTGTITLSGEIATLRVPPSFRFL
jgi:hypothetical protein